MQLWSICQALLLTDYLTSFRFVFRAPGAFACALKVATVRFLHHCRKRFAARLTYDSQLDARITRGTFVKVHPAPVDPAVGRFRLQDLQHGRRSVRVKVGPPVERWVGATVRSFPYVTGIKSVKKRKRMKRIVYGCVSVQNNVIKLIQKVQKQSWVWERHGHGNTSMYYI